MDEKIKLIDKFYGGIVRDDRSKLPGAAYNVEELDIYSNADFMQPEQIFSADALPASTEAYAYASDNADQVWIYGKQTSDSAVRLMKVTSAGDDNPGAISTVFTSADTTDVAYSKSPLAYHRRDDGTQNFLYYMTNASGTVKLKAYDISGASESETDTGATAMTLTKLDASFDRTFIKPIYSDLMIGNGQYITKVDKDGVFTEDAFTLPNGWEAVDIVPVSDVAIILARSINRNANFCKGFWWDLTTSAQFDDAFDIPFGGPQWIQNHKETIKIMCAIGGRARFYQLSGAFPGAIPIELPSMTLSNIAAETATQNISAPKMVTVKDNLLFFGIYKTDKTGMYAIGQLDSDKPQALSLSKRFHTSDYSLHKPTGIHTHGPNFFAAFDDNGTASTARCETNNSPTRSSNAVYESVAIDDGNPALEKAVPQIYVTAKPLAASTAVALSTESDYSGSYTAATRADGTSLNTTSAIQGEFNTNLAGIKTVRVKLTFTSSGTSAPKVTGIGVRVKVKRVPASK